MEADSFVLPKTLHLLIKKFIVAIENYVELKNVDKNKVYLEVLKRSFNISQGIRTMALSVLTSEIAGRPISEDVLTKKVECLMEAYLQQDLIECALNFKSGTCQYVTNGNLHDYLYLCSINDKNSMTASFAEPLSAMSLEFFQLPYSEEHIPTSSETTKDLESIMLSSQFDRSRIQFEEDLSQLKLTFGNESPSSDHRNSEIYSKLNSEAIGGSRSSGSCVYNEHDILQHNEFDEWLLCASSKSCDDISNFYNLSGNTWEGRMKQFVPCHLYSSELTDKEATLNITDDDPQIFRSLYDFSTVISEDNMKYDILDLLVGIPSSTFSYDNDKKKFQVKPHIHLAKLSHGSTLRFLEKFIDSGTMFQRLQMFSTEQSADEGCILRGLKTGIQQVLTLFSKYILAVKMKNPDFQFLETDVLETAQSLNILETMCKTENKESNCVQLPKGLGLLTYLNEFLWPHRSKENVLMIGVIFKHAYIPYFNYLNKWIEEGICNDPYSEFQIIEDFNFLDRKDELYWKLAYTENFDDPMRKVPTEIQNFTTDILQCGKNMRLLKICCPQLHSLEYIFRCPPPSLSLIFSYCAATAKSENCCDYIKEKEKQESECYEIKNAPCEEELLIHKQYLVSKEDIALRGKVRWNHLCTNNLSTFDSNCAKITHFIRRCKSLENVVADSNLYSGIVYPGVGLLFSSCDFISEQKNSHSSFKSVFEQASSHRLDGEHPLKYTVSSSRTLVFHPICSSKHSFESGTETKTQFQKSHNDYIPKSSSKEFKTSLVNDLAVNFPTVKKDISGTAKDNSHFLGECNSCETDEEILPGTFMSSLTSLLTSDCGDTNQNVYSCLQLISLQSLMSYSIKPVLDMRMHIVKKIIKDYVMNQLKLQDLLICLRNTYLLLDETFSQQLCEKLFPWTMSCQTVYQYSNWPVLNEIFCNSISKPACSNSLFLLTGSVVVVDLPENDILERNEYLHFFQFEFQISWPLNIIIHKACIAKYMDIFSFLLELDFLSWLLGVTWQSLMCHEKFAEIENSSQFRKIMLSRFDMHQFICILRNCIRHDLQGPVWDFLSRSLSIEELSIDALEDIHIQYLEKVLTRCFLTKQTQILHEIMAVLCRQIYKFCIWTRDCFWELNATTKQYETPAFSDLNSVSETYAKYQKTFYDRILKMTVLRKYRVTEISGYEGFKQYLESLLESNRKFL